MTSDDFSNSKSSSSIARENQKKPSGVKLKESVLNPAPIATDESLKETSSTLSETPLYGTTLLPENYPANPEPNEHQIRECAYYLWKSAGEPEGGDWEFWEQARAKLASQQDPNATILSNPIDVDMNQGLPDIFKE